MLQFLIPLVKTIFVSKATELVKDGFEKATKSGDPETIKPFAKLLDKSFLHSKRFWVSSIGVLVVMFNRKLGLDLNLEEISAITTLIVGYVGMKTYEQKV